jgi:hypothetical protein
VSLGDLEPLDVAGWELQRRLGELRPEQDTAGDGATPQAGLLRRTGRA